MGKYRPTKGISMRGLLALCVLLLLSTVAAAADIFVDNVTGDDRRTGGDLKSDGVGNGPVRTITKALRLANKGDRIILANHEGQPYRESIAISGGFHSGMPDFPFTLIGNGATLDGSLSLIEAEWEFVSGDIFRVRPPKGAFQRLFLDDVLLPFVRAQGEARPQLQPKQWTLLGGYIYFRGEKDRIPSSYNLSCCGLQTGITLYQVDGVLVQDLFVRGFQLDGVNAADTARNTTLLGVVSLDNGRSGITVAGASRVTLDQCTASGNGNSQLRAEGYSQTTVRDTELDATTAPAVVQDGGKVFAVRAN
jgi:hypothetical protein